MKVLITGGTGFIGRALVPALRAGGDHVVVWTRDADRERSLAAAIDGCDAVVNLAGAPILGARWTPGRRNELYDSRVGLTSDLVRAWGAVRRPPRVLISGSAVGVYGDRGDQWLTEQSAGGDDFLARLCAGWEAAARGAERLGARVVLLRTGVVLGADGGALAPMLPLFRAGLGGPVGSGRQFLPWIHRHDLVRVIEAALTDNRLRGPVNGVAPAPVTSRQFAAALGGALRRPAVLPAPSFAVRALFGEAATVLLGSQRVDPAALRARRFTWTYSDIGCALGHIVAGERRAA